MPRSISLFFSFPTSKSILQIHKDYSNTRDPSIHFQYSKLKTRKIVFDQTLLTQFPYYRHRWKKGWSAWRLLIASPRHPSLGVKFYFKHDACNARRIFHSHNVVKKRNASDECQGLASSNRYHATVKRRVHWR